MAQAFDPNKFFGEATPDKVDWCLKQIENGRFRQALQGYIDSLMVNGARFPGANQVVRPGETFYCTACKRDFESYGYHKLGAVVRVLASNLNGPQGAEGFPQFKLHGVFVHRNNVEGYCFVKSQQCTFRDIYTYEDMATTSASGSLVGQEEEKEQVMDEAKVAEWQKNLIKARAEQEVKRAAILEKAEKHKGLLLSEIGKNSMGQDLAPLKLPPIIGAEILLGVDFEDLTLKPSAWDGDLDPDHLIDYDKNPEAFSYYRMVKTSSEYSQVMDVAASLSASGWGLHASMSAAVSQSKTIKAKTTSLLAISCVERAEKRVRDYRSTLTMKEAAKDLALSGDAEAFRQAYGTHVIIGYRLGGMMHVQGILETTAVGTTQEISAKLETSWLGGSLDGSFKQTLHDFSDHFNLSWLIRTKGLAYDQPQPTVTDSDHMLEYLEKFPSTITEDTSSIMYYIAVPHTLIMPDSLRPPTPVIIQTDPRLFTDACCLCYMMGEYLSMEPDDRQLSLKQGLYGQLTYLYELYKSKSSQDLLSDLDKFLKTTEDVTQLAIQWKNFCRQLDSWKIVGFKYWIRSNNGDIVASSDGLIGSRETNTSFTTQGTTWFEERRYIEVRWYMDNNWSCADDKFVVGCYVLEAQSGTPFYREKNKIGSRTGEEKPVFEFYTEDSEKSRYNRFITIWDGDEKNALAVRKLMASEDTLFGKTKATGFVYPLFTLNEGVGLGQREFSLFLADNGI